MKIYIDAEFKCHTSNHEGAYREFETDFFDGKCAAFISGYIFVPAGESWIRDDGEEFQGEMISPWNDSRVLDAYQEEYERSGALVNELIGGVNDVQYE